jgi:hypothetical protein
MSRCQVQSGPRSLFAGGCFGAKVGIHRASGIHDQIAPFVVSTWLGLAGNAGKFDTGHNLRDHGHRQQGDSKSKNDY